VREYPSAVLNQPVDVSMAFARLENVFFNAMRLVAFDPQTASGTLEWRRYGLSSRMSFSGTEIGFEDKSAQPLFQDIATTALPFSLSFVSPRTVRLRLATGPSPTAAKGPSLMLVSEPIDGAPWEMHQQEELTVYRSPFGSVTVTRDPWHVEFRDVDGRLLTSTQHLTDTKSLKNCDPTPFSFVRQVADLRRHIAASFSLAPDEKLFGCGESFTRLDKRGQKLVLYTKDALGVQTPEMYKPIPFFLSSRGYGMFVHTSAPLTFDFGHSYDGANVIYLGDDTLDLFVFLGTPKEILSEYTALTGRSPLPPLWSFGLWMSRITYNSEEQARDVAAKLRHHRVPCDVIHLDTGWFETDWQCDYKFSRSRFKDPAQMITDLRQQGFRVSLWQLPYFTPQNVLYPEMVGAGYAVRGADGGLPGQDAVIDFSNPAAEKWYQDLLRGLLEIGVAAIKVDFGEGAPLNGAYASGKSGFYEHNLYPLRYNKAASEITHQVTGEWIIWARSTWAGGQRYPIHWGGDAENTDNAMAATLRAGLSFGLCGFSFWSHDIGGFVQPSPRALYCRWLPFGMLTSHSRCHGAPPKEPWAYDAEFVADFRRADELKYALMPYVYAQAKDCSEHGLPMVRTLFLEYPDDPTSWFIEDEYLFGRDLLVAPLMEETSGRAVYLPPGLWIDYQTHKVYAGGRWHTIEAGEIPAVILVRDGAAIPHIPVAQSTDQMDWSQVELQVFRSEAAVAEGLLCLPTDGVLHTLRLKSAGDGFALTEDPFGGKVRWQVRVVNGFS